MIESLILLFHYIVKSISYRLRRGEDDEIRTNNEIYLNKKIFAIKAISV